MKSKIKLIASDMDGTLLDSNQHISKYTLVTIEEAIEKGVFFVPATGRGINALPKPVKEIAGVRYGIFCNGATVYDFVEEKVIYENQFSTEEMLDFIKVARGYDCMISVTQGGQSYSETYPMEHIDDYHLDTYTKDLVLASRKRVDSLDDFLIQQNKSIEKATLLFADMKVREDVKKT